MSSKVVITGAAGFIGSQLALRLHREGHEVIAIDDLSFGYESNPIRDGKPFVKLQQVDVRSAALASHFDGADCVFNMAAISALAVNQSEPGRGISVNVAGSTTKASSVLHWMTQVSMRDGLQRTIDHARKALQ